MVMGSIDGKSKNQKRATSIGEINYNHDHDTKKQPFSKKAFGRNCVYHDSDYDRKVKFISNIKAREDIYLKQ